MAEVSVNRLLVVIGMLLSVVATQGNLHCVSKKLLRLENEFVLHPEKLDSLFYRASISALLKVRNL